MFSFQNPIGFLLDYYQKKIIRKKLNDFHRYFFPTIIHAQRLLFSIDIPGSVRMFEQAVCLKEIFTKINLDNRNPIFYYSLITNDLFDFLVLLEKKLEESLLQINSKHSEYYMISLCLRNTIELKKMIHLIMLTDYELLPEVTFLFQHE